jgi:hypothetical protein
MWGALSDERMGLLQLLLAFDIAVSFRSELLETHDHIFLSQIRDFPNLEGQFLISQEQGGPVTPQALGSVFVASDDSQGYGGYIQSRLHAGMTKFG